MFAGLNHEYDLKCKEMQWKLIHYVNCVNIILWNIQDESCLYCPCLCQIVAFSMQHSFYNDTTMTVPKSSKLAETMIITVWAGL